MGTAEWYFRMGGDVSGPFDLDTMRGFRRAGLLKAESEVSLLSIPGKWIAAGETEVFRDPSSEQTPSPPPAVLEAQIASSDGFAWALAIAALGLTIFEAQAFRMGIPPFYDDWFIKWGWLFYLFVSGLLANADIDRNKYLLTSRQIALVLLVPAYFWLRQRRTKSSSAMLLANLTAIALSFAVTFGKIPVLGGLNLNSCYSSGIEDVVISLLKGPAFKLGGSVELLRSIHETSYDGKTRVCLAEIITNTNIRHAIEFSTELTKNDSDEYVRVRLVN